MNEKAAPGIKHLLEAHPYLREKEGYLKLYFPAMIHLLESKFIEYGEALFQDLMRDCKIPEVSLKEAVAICLPKEQTQQ